LKIIFNIRFCLVLPKQNLLYNILINQLLIHFLFLFFNESFPLPLS